MSYRIRLWDAVEPLRALVVCRSVRLEDAPTPSSDQQDQASNLLTRQLNTGKTLHCALIRSAAPMQPARAYAARRQPSTRCLWTGEDHERPRAKTMVQKRGALPSASIDTDPASLPGYNARAGESRWPCIARPAQALALGAPSPESRPVAKAHPLHPRG